MTHGHGWLGELPLNAPERELLVRGKKAEPPHGAVDRGWNALGLAVGAAGLATASLTTASAKAAGLGASAATSGAVAATVTSTGIGIALVTKSLAVGFVVGVGVLGTAEVATRATSLPVERPSVTTLANSRAEPVRRPSPMVGNLDQTGAQVSDEPARTRLPSGERAPVLPSSAVGFQEGMTKGPNALADEARELAEIQRFLDQGDIDKALGSLEGTHGRKAPFGLAEERDALTIDALMRAGQRPRAERLAVRFLHDHPRSPHAAKMRELVGSK